MQVLVDVPAVEALGLVEAHPSTIELPPAYCFDLTPSDMNRWSGRATRPGALFSRSIDKKSCHWLRRS
ncbi:unnamed protein product [Macrosiphum euphorbiae]|uniref:Uncharacterized protein n=1 Tax=Macrosiphum euphorbiae TaxID=13131 RepID=A0AAV0WTI4_9HEMI|nr:unnamed protein product [Macrosiphum euphorbiae]